MKVQIDFYSRDEVSVILEPKMGEAANEKLTELMLFAWYTLRQFHNLGQNTVVDAFVGLLAWNGAITELIKTRPQIPPVIDLLMRGNSAALDDVERVDPDMELLSRIGALKQKAHATTGLTAAESVALRSRLEKDPAVGIIERDYLKSFPLIVDCCTGPAGKRFVARFGYGQRSQKPACNLQAEGFGILGQGINYYAPHSIVALLRFLTRKRTNDETYLKRLALVAHSCGKAHKQGRISTANQYELANAIVAAAEQSA